MKQHEAAAAAAAKKAAEAAAAMVAAQNAQFMAACQMRSNGRCEGCGQ